MNRTSPRVQALLCSLVLLGCVAFSRPVANIGIYDDWSYIRTAQLLAETGKIHYNGWATAMLGWQLFPAALCFRLFGFSFTVARLTTVAAAAASTYLMHRCAVRCGILAWNATVATLTVSLSPLFLPLATTFMSDVFGLFAMMACLYCCLRALDETAKGVPGWLAAAAIVSVVGGTARQTAWLGALVMVPSTTWLLRRRRGAFLTGGAALGCSLLAVLWAMHWFRQQPYAVPETFANAHITASAAITAAINFERLGLELGMLMLPALLVFCPALFGSRPGQILLASCASVAAVVFLVVRHRFHLGSLLVPTLLDGGNYVALQGLLTTSPEHGTRHVLVTEPIRRVLTLAIGVGVLGVLSALCLRSVRVEKPATSPLRSWREVLMLLLPFTVGYLALLAPRAMFFHPYDRYTLPLMVMASLLLFRLYQDRVRQVVPLWAVVPVIAAGMYSVGVTHDMFAMFRATEAATLEVEASGVSRAELDGGWEYNGWTQVVMSGYIHEPRLHLPGEAEASAKQDPRVCPLDAPFLFPEVQPVYSLALDPKQCLGPAPFAPVTYRTWMPFSDKTVYVVRNGLPPA